MYELYLKAYENNLTKYKEEKVNAKDTLKKLIYYGIMVVNTKPKETSTIDAITDDFNFIQTILLGIGSLTPRELINIFPIDKTYDGDKYGTKDYYYTMGYIKEHGIDTVIGNGFEFLYEYMNIKTRLFTVEVMSSMDNIRELEGKQSVIGEFLEENGVRSHTLHQDNKGKEYFIKGGKAIKVKAPKKRKPKYLKLVK